MSMVDYLQFDYESNYCKKMFLTIQSYDYVPKKLLTVYLKVSITITIQQSFQLHPLFEYSSSFVHMVSEIIYFEVVSNKRR